MKLTTILGAIGSGAGIFKAASNVALLAGALYLVDCRLSSPGPQGRDACWMTALPIAGIGAMGRGGFQIGYGTYNPALRPEDHANAERDESGRFKRRQS